MIADNAVANAQAKPGSLVSRFGGKKRVRYFIYYVWRYACAVITEYYFYIGCVVNGCRFTGYLQDFIYMLRRLLFTQCILRIADKV